MRTLPHTELQPPLATWKRWGRLLAHTHIKPTMVASANTLKTFAKYAADQDARWGTTMNNNGTPICL